MSRTLVDRLRELRIRVKRAVRIGKSRFANRKTFLLAVDILRLAVWIAKQVNQDSK